MSNPESAIFTLKLIIAAFFLLFTSLNVNAEPLTFSNVSAFQNDGTTTLDLLSNPNVQLVGPQLTFRVDISGTLQAGATDSLLVTFGDAQGGLVTQSFQIPLFGTVSPPLTLLFTVDAPHGSLSGVPATLTLDLINSSPDFVIPSSGQQVNTFTYSFNVVQPVPEPTTVTLVVTGLVGLLARRKIFPQKSK